MKRMTVKRSTIFISVGDRTSVYSSLEEIPPPLRRKLHESTNGLNAATILIADRNGREEIVKALQGLPSDVRPRTAGRRKNGRAGARSGKVDWWTWLEFGLAGAVGLLIWLAFVYR